MSKKSPLGSRLTLTLNREHLRRLGADELDCAAGGATGVCAPSQVCSRLGCPPPKTADCPE
jgi:hypothetical protein